MFPIVEPITGDTQECFDVSFDNWLVKENWMKIIDAINDDNEVCGNALNVVRKKLGLHLNSETGCHY